MILIVPICVFDVNYDCKLLFYTIALFTHLKIISLFKTLVMY